MVHPGTSSDCDATAGELANVATVVADTDDPDPSNNTGPGPTDSGPTGTTPPGSPGPPDDGCPDCPPLPDTGVAAAAMTGWALLFLLIGAGLTVIGRRPSRVGGRHN